jgi:tRNA-specific 2-thiouridylase
VARVFVAMSGGVDSSLAAAILLEGGHDVTGVTMRLLGPGADGQECCSADGARSAKRVCDALGIAHYTLEFTDVFSREVVEPYVAEYAAGRTPNPCIACNDRVKFGELWRRVTLQGADFLATGHYARIASGPDGAPMLAKAVDERKDQSYFLYRMTPAQMSHTLFPLGGMTKVEVRARAAELRLPSARRAESQDGCFVPAGGVRAFLRDRCPGAFHAGPFVDRAGQVLGRHEGVPGITVGQRRGLGLQQAEGLYVSEIVPETSTVVMEARAALLKSRMVAVDTVWSSGVGPRPVTVRTRHRGPEVAGVAHWERGRVSAELAEPVEAPAPGQALVCYEGDTVVGGGVIEEVA